MILRLGSLVLQNSARGKHKVPGLGGEKAEYFIQSGEAISTNHNPLVYSFMGWEGKDSCIPALPLN